MLRLLLAAVLLAGCTTYSEMGFSGGVESEWVADDVLSVTALGNAFATRERIRDFTQLRAAEEAVNNGFLYFNIVDRDDLSRSDSYYVPESSTTTTYGSVYGNTFSGTSYTNTSGGYYQNTYKPGEEILVRMTHESLGRHSVDAASIIEELGPRYLNDERLLQLRNAASAAQLNASGVSEK